MWYPKNKQIYKPLICRIYMRKIRKFVYSFVCAGLIGCSSGERGKISELYTLAQNNPDRGSLLVDIAGKQYAVLALEKDERKTLQIDVHGEGGLKRHFFDYDLDGKLDEDPIPVLVSEMKTPIGTERVYGYSPASDKLEIEKEYLNAVRKVLDVLDKKSKI